MNGGEIILFVMVLISWVYVRISYSSKKTKNKKMSIKVSEIDEMIRQEKEKWRQKK